MNIKSVIAGIIVILIVLVFSITVFMNFKEDREDKNNKIDELKSELSEVKKKSIEVKNVNKGNQAINDIDNINKDFVDNIYKFDKDTDFTKLNKEVKKYTTDSVYKNVSNIRPQYNLDVESDYSNLKRYYEFKDDNKDEYSTIMTFDQNMITEDENTDYEITLKLSYTKSKDKYVINNFEILDNSEIEKD